MGDESQVNRRNATDVVGLHIFPGKPGPNFKEPRRYKAAYEDWKRYWTKLLVDIGSEDKIVPDEFFKQDYVAVLMLGEEAVGTICINSYNSECGLFEHTFFSTFERDFYEYMRERRVSRFFSVQWFMVHEKFSPMTTGISFPSILVGVGHKLYQRHKTADSAMIAMSRTDIAASNTARKFGWVTVGATKVLHNVTCDQLVLVGDPKPHPRAEINKMVDEFWARRIEHDRGFGDTATEEIKKAA